MTRAPNDRLSYRVSAGYFTSAAFARPTGRIPVIDDPRQRGGVSSLTRDTRTPGHTGESARTRYRRDEEPHEPDLCQPGSGASWRRVRRGRPSPGRTRPEHGQHHVARQRRQ